jgi:hypothetical protein
MLGIMNMHKYLALILAVICIAPALANAKSLRHTIKFKAAESAAIGSVEKLVVTVSVFAAKV